MTTLKREVVVVGAGPAGSATAALLAGQYGHDVLVLDRARFPRSKPCAEYVSAGGVRLLNTHLGWPDSAPVGRCLRGMELWAPDGERHLLEYRDGAGARACGLAVARTELDTALLVAARARGAEVREGVRVDRLVYDGSGRVSGVLARDDAGHQIAVGARLVIGADGAYSVVARQLGLRVTHRWPKRLGLVMHLRGVAWPEDYGQMHVGRRGYVGVAPLSADETGRVSVGLVRPLPRRALGSPEAALWTALADYPALAHRLAAGRREGVVQGVGPLTHGVRTCAGPGFLLVGDAAGFLDPFTGEGIFRALRGAELAAAAAEEALRQAGWVAVPSPQYARCRRAAFGAKERLTWLIQLFVHCPAAMSYVVARLSRRPAVAATLASALGDLGPASACLQPGYLWALLGP